MKKFFFSLVVLIAGLVLVASSQGQGYPNGYYYQQPQYHYQQQHYDYQVNPIVVIGVPVSNLGVPYYWSVGNELREERIAQRAAQLAREKKGSESPKPTKPEVGLTLDFDLVSGAAAPAPISSVQETSLDSQVKAIFTESCATCHKPGSTRGVQLFSADGSLFHESDWKKEVRRRELVYDSMRATEGVSPMPKNSDQLPDEKIEIIYQWLREQTAR